MSPYYSLELHRLYELLSTKKEPERKIDADCNSESYRTRDLTHFQDTIKYEKMHTFFVSYLGTLAATFPPPEAIAW